MLLLARLRQFWVGAVSSWAFCPNVCLTILLVRTNAYAFLFVVCRKGFIGTLKKNLKFLEGIANAV